MADHRFAPEESLPAFREGAAWWRSLVGGIEDHQWDLPALGEWNVRELVAHTARAFKTVTEYATGAVKDPTPIETAAEYFRIVLAEQTPHVHIAARARKEAGDHADWVAATDQLWTAAELVVNDLPFDHPMHLFVGEMRLDQYLATRAVELVVHGLDLAEVIGIPSNPPPMSGQVAVSVLLDLATSDDVSAVVRSLTGRPGPRPGNVLA